MQRTLHSLLYVLSTLYSTSRLHILSMYLVQTCWLQMAFCCKEMSNINLDTYMTPHGS
jgi:hypothetical protein